MDQPFYIISNASKDVFPDNTLTEFKNVFPKTLSFPENERWEVGLEAIGVSSMFRNVSLPKKDFPSIYVVHDKERTPNYKENLHFAETIDWHKEMFFDLTKQPNLPGATFHLPDKYYSKAEVYSLCSLINFKLNAYCLFRYDGERLTISYQDEENFNYIGTWVLLHETFLRTFRFKRYKVMDCKVRPNSIPPGVVANSNQVRLVQIGSNLYFERKVIYNGETYYGFYLSKDTKIPGHGPLISEKFNIEKSSRIPDVIKVQCDIIEPQILNSSYSQDLLVLSADIHYTNRYFYHEIEKISYIPLLFNDISQIKIQLVDQKNKLLELVEGHASIVKLRFRRNFNMTGNFYCRLTSKPNEVYKNNKINNFAVQLPSTKFLDDGWKVSLNSINIPNNFTTFLPSKNKKLYSIVYKKGMDPAIPYYFKTNIKYSPSRLVSELNLFFLENDIGTVTLDQLNRLTFLLNDENSSFAIGLDLCRVLGYETGHLLDDFMITRPLTPQKKLIIFDSPIDCDYFRPNYFIIYSNIVQPSIIGSQYSPILKIVPVLDGNEPYKLLDFKVREFYNIPNSEVNEIKIELRTHDGELVNFVESEHVVMNLQFSNDTKNV